MNNVETAVVLESSDYRVEPQSWGRLTWFADAALGGAVGVTAGECRILPGKENPRHHHPNCEEVLRVLQGTIEHTVGNAGAKVVMHPGQTIVVPAGVVHNARNIGTDEAVLAICFSNARRQTVGE